MASAAMIRATPQASMWLINSFSHWRGRRSMGVNCFPFDAFIYISSLAAISSYPSKSCPGVILGYWAKLFYRAVIL